MDLTSEVGGGDNDVLARVWIRQRVLVTTKHEMGGVLDEVVVAVNREVCAELW